MRTCLNSFAFTVSQTKAHKIEDAMMLQLKLKPMILKPMTPELDLKSCFFSLTCFCVCGSRDVKEKGLSLSVDDSLYILNTREVTGQAATV